MVDPAVTPSGAHATVQLLGGLGGGGQGGQCGASASEKAGFNARTRYTNESDLSMASTSYETSGHDSDEDELAAMFSLQAWKRFYGYNRKKHADLLSYFWRKFNPQEYSLWCISYAQQDLFLSPYMAENVVAGYTARLEDLALADSLFLQMYVLHDFEIDLYRVVGLLLVQGPTLPAPLQHLSAYDGFVYARADTRVVLVKQFVSALLVGKSPVNTLQLLSARELL